MKILKTWKNDYTGEESQRFFNTESDEDMTTMGKYYNTERNEKYYKVQELTSDDLEVLIQEATQKFLEDELYYFKNSLRAYQVKIEEVNKEIAHIEKRLRQLTF